MQEIGKRAMQETGKSDAGNRQEESALAHWRQSSEWLSACGKKFLPVCGAQDEML
jgi:hypothetical protein